MHNAHHVDVALVVFGLLVAVGSAGLARLALTQLDRDEKAEMSRIDRDFSDRLPLMRDRGSRPVKRY